MSSPELEYNTPPVAYNTPPALIAFTLTILVLCFVAFSLAYLCKYCFASILHTWTMTRTASGSLVRLSPERPPSNGLDPALIEKFPIFRYSCVKNLRKETSFCLECAVCLIEFEDDSMLRHLTVCCHVFHQECIDLWLCSHKTCPVCRTDLELVSGQMPKEEESIEQEGIGTGMDMGMDTGTSSVVPCDDHVSIDIDVREEQEEESNNEVVCESTTVVVEEKKNEPEERRHPSVRAIMQQEEHKFARSHSTGHSIVMVRGEGSEERGDEKYTLILPEHVMRRGHSYTKSCVSYNDQITIPTPCSNCGFIQPVVSSPLVHPQES